MEFGKKTINYILKWTLIGILTGVFGGLIGTMFHISVDFVTDLRENNFFLILLLPAGGLVIAGIYNIFSAKGNIDTKRVFQAVKEEKDVPVIMIPMIFLGTVITHLFGGSAGREGAALQLGGSMGYNLGKALKLNKNDLKIIVTSGMSSVFAALFGTPLAATVFSLEVTKRGRLNFCGLLPGVFSSATAFIIADAFGVEPVRFNIPLTYDIHPVLLLKIFVLAVCFALGCIILATAINKTEVMMKKVAPNVFVRAFAGGFTIVVLTVLLKTTDYNGAGMDAIKGAVMGNAKYEAFILKIILTAITVASGFKGGEIVPTFFVGATLGCVAGKFIGLDGGFGAALGLVGMFSGMTKCPIASFIIAVEIFGYQGMAFFLVIVVLTYILSGSFGLYDNENFFSQYKKRKLMHKTEV